MPELSRFLGIIIRMYMEASVHHNTPHFHAYYHDEAGVFSIDTLDLIAGSIPKRQRRFVEAWAEIHKEELINDWGLLQSEDCHFPLNL